MSKIPCILKTNTISLFIDGKSYVAERSIPEWDALVAAINTGDEAAVLAIVDKPKTIGDRLTAQGLTGIQVTENAVYYNGKPLTNYAASRLLEMKSLGLDVAPITAFLGRLLLNPSFRAVQELFRFLEASDMPITEDGHFLAYKVVRNDYRDCHSGTFDNSVGTMPRVERNQVDEDPNRTCSYGLHVCSKGYIRSFRSGDNRLMLVKVDPADVVAVPHDYNNSKMRVCGYEVLKEIEEAIEWGSRIVDGAGDTEYNYDDSALDDDYFDEYEDAEIHIDGVSVAGPQGTLKNLLGRLFKRS